MSDYSIRCLSHLTCPVCVAVLGSGEGRTTDREMLVAWGSVSDVFRYAGFKGSL